MGTVVLEVLLPLTGLPLYVVALVLLGTWVFFRGRAVMVRPPSRIDLKMEDAQVSDLALALSAREQVVLPRPVGTSEDREKQVEDGRLEDAVEPDEPLNEGEVEDHPGNGDAETAVEVADIDPVRIGPAPDRGDGYRRFPLHDAPLWLMAWMGLLILTTLLLIVDGLLQLQSGAGSPLEEIVFSWIPWVGDRTPFPRPTIALLVYTGLGYVGLELGVRLLRSGLALNRLHLMHPRDARRRLARWLYKLYGFHEFRTLDYSFPRWLFPVTVLVSCGLLAGDLLLFYGGAPGWCGPLALAHLLPVVLARVFDYAWLTDVSWSRKTASARDRVDIHDLPDRLAEEGLVFSMEDGLAARLLLQGPSPGHVRPFGDEDGDLPKELLLALANSETWYAHQARAWDEVRKGRNVLLSLPNDAGRSVWAHCVAVRKVVMEAGGVLLIYPDAAEARRQRTRLSRALAGTSLWWNLDVHDATSQQFASLDLESETPFLIVSDLDTFGEEMLVYWERYRPFWRLLRLIVLEDVDRMSGVRASNLYYLIRRLETLRKRDTATSIQYAATSFPLGSSLLSGLQELVGAEFVRMESDTAPRAPVELCAVLPPTGKSSAFRRFAPDLPIPEILRTAARVRQMGHDPVWLEPSALTREERMREEELGVYDEFSDLKLDLPLSAARVSIAYAGGAGGWKLPLALAHAGTHCSSRPRGEDGPSDGAGNAELHVALVILKPDALSLLLLRVLEERSGSPAEDAALPRPGMFAFSRENGLLQRRHLLASLRETAMRLEELVSLFGQEVVEREIANLRAENRLERLDVAGIESRTRYRLREGVRQEPLEALVVGDESVHVVSPALGRDRFGRDVELFQVDAARFHTALYPGKVLTNQGVRYRVPVRELPGTVGGERIVVAREIREVFTTKIRTWQLSPADRGRPAEPTRCQVGSQAFALDVGWYRLREDIIGYREWTNDTLVPLGTVWYARTALAGPVRGTMEVPVLKVLFPGAEMSWEAQGGLSSLMRLVLSFRHLNESSTPDVLERASQSEAGLDSVDAYEGQPGFVISDVFPGGVGYVERVTPDDVVAMLRLAQKLLHVVGAERPELLFRNPNCFESIGRTTDGPEGAAGAVVPRRLQPIDAVLPDGEEDSEASAESMAAVVEELAAFLEQVVPASARVSTLEDNVDGPKAQGPQDEREETGAPGLEAALHAAREISRTKVTRSR